MTDRNVPFHEVIHRICGHYVTQLSLNDPQDRDLVVRLRTVAERSMREMQIYPIERSRPNEVGNDVEAYVKRAIEQDVGFEIVNMGQSTGYPDIMIRVDGRRVVYIECKTFNPDSLNSSLRSFYLSPSKTFKVKYSGNHVAISFGMNRDGNSYTPFAYKIVDLHDLPCNLKSEWNSDNRRLYESQRVLASYS